MNIIKIPVGSMQQNCYILYDSGEGIIVDPGAEGEKILSKIGNLNIKYVVLTHNHFDHVGAVDTVCEKTGARLAIHKDDIPQLTAFPDIFRFAKPPEKKVDLSLSDGDIINFGNSEIRIMHTPGHTAGGISLISHQGIFCGDTLFFESIGRTDFPGGNFEALLASVNKILSFPDDTVLYSGHGSDTTVLHEKKFNLFIR